MEEKNNKMVIFKIVVCFILFLVTSLPCFPQENIESKKITEALPTSGLREAISIGDYVIYKTDVREGDYISSLHQVDLTNTKQTPRTIFKFGGNQAAWNPRILDATSNKKVLMNIRCVKSWGVKNNYPKTTNTEENMVENVVLYNPNENNFENITQSSGLNDVLKGFQWLEKQKLILAGTTSDVYSNDMGIFPNPWAGWSPVYLSVDGSMKEIEKSKILDLYMTHVEIEKEWIF